MRAVVVGATSWGRTLASLIGCAGGGAIVLCRSAEEARRCADAAPDLAFEAEASGDADAVIWAVPAQRMRENLRTAQVPSAAVHVSAAKGIERGTLLRMTEVLREELGDAPVAALSGPNLAGEIARGLPAASVAASDSAEAAELVRGLLSSPSFRVYTNRDVAGVELGGALKNVMAIAVGMAVALEAGDNARAALMTRGLAELARLGEALGGEAGTFAGLSGMGDLLATCMSPHSRNRAFGERIGRGMKLEEALAASAGVVEGLETTPVALALAERAGAAMPVAELVSRVLFEGLDPRRAIPLLMEREPRGE